jgi:hypothetical protein
VAWLWVLCCTEILKSNCGYLNQRDFGAPISSLTTGAKLIAKRCLLEKQEHHQKANNRILSYS